MSTEMEIIEMAVEIENPDWDLARSMLVYDDGELNVGWDITETPKLRISNFTVVYVEDTIHEGWVTCDVEFFDKDGEWDKLFTAKSAVGFSEDGGCLIDSRFNKGVGKEGFGPQIREAMEQYLDHPDVKKEISDEHTYALEQWAELEEEDDDY